MAGLVQRGVGVGIPKENQAMIPSAVDIFDEQGNNIGFINNFAPTHRRPADRLRHLNSADAGRPLEQSPRPEDVTITVGGFGLFAKSLSDRGSLLNRIPGPDGAAFNTLKIKIARMYPPRERDVPGDLGRQPADHVRVVHPRLDDIGPGFPEPVGQPQHLQRVRHTPAHPHRPHGHPQRPYLFPNGTDVRQRNHLRVKGRSVHP